MTEAVRRKPYQLILLDEIEKAHPDTFNILLQMLDEGRLTDNKGRTADFKNTIIIMTSNMASDKIQQAFENAKTPEEREKAAEKAKEEVMQELKRRVRPEFLNRIDEIIMFKPLTKNEIIDIVKIQLNKVAKMLKEQNINVEFTDRAIEYLADKGFDPEFGARPVKRVIQRDILNNLSKDSLAGKVSTGSTIVVDYQDGQIVFKNKA